jgi:hypothetical protein
MAKYDAADNAVLRMPPPENWCEQTFGYGFYLDYTLATDYSGSLRPNLGVVGQVPFAEAMHMLNLNPKDIQVEEPKATEILKTQGGGKFIESRGDVEKTIHISGTTGLLPPTAAFAEHMKPPTRSQLEGSNALLGAYLHAHSSGFYEFYHLRQLFRRFGVERKKGESVHMHWLDFKGDEFWVIEPRRFSMTRGKFTYQYNISFDCIVPSEAPILKMTQRPSNLLSGLPMNAYLDTPTRAWFTRMGQLSSKAKKFVQRFALGVVGLKMQEVISIFTQLQSVLADAAAIRRAALDVPLGFYRQLDSALTGLRDSYDQLAGDAFKSEVNEWFLEMQFLTDRMRTHHSRRFSQSPGQALVEANTTFTTPEGRNGFTSSLMEEPAGSTGELRMSPTLGTSGFDLIGSVQQMAAVTALRREDVLTGETIFDVAQRVLGDVHRFVDLIVLNNLQSPFIVADSTDKPVGTLAWGESIMVPTSDASGSYATAVPVDTAVPAIQGTVDAPSATTTVVDTDMEWRIDQWAGFTVEFTSGANDGEKRVITENTATALTVNRAWLAAPAIGDTYKVYLELFSRRRPVTAETRAYGRDIMAVFTPTGITCMLGPSGDLMSVEGEENFKQAMTMRLQTPQGSNKLHPKYGTPDVIGRRLEPNTLALYTFFSRQSLLADPRVARVERPTYTVQNGVMTFEAAIQAVRTQKTTLFRVAV